MLIALILAGALFALAGLLMLLARRQRAATGLPPGRVIAADTGAWRKLEKPLYDPETGLAGRPDYVLEQRGAVIPVEVKSGWAPAQPHDGHVYQLAAYCYLLERSGQRRPPYGVLHYRNRTFAVDYTPALEERLLALLDDIHAHQRKAEVARSHESAARCRSCGYREVCNQRL